MIAYVPWPNPVHELYLPEPDLGDSVRNESTVIIKRSMANTKKTVICQVPNNVRNYRFELTQAKALELLKWIESHPAQQWSLDKQVGYLKVNPVELAYVRRGKVDNSNDVVQVEIEFEVLSVRP